MPADQRRRQEGKLNDPSGAQQDKLGPGLVRDSNDEERGAEARRQKSGAIENKLFGKGISRSESPAAVAGQFSGHSRFKAAFLASLWCVFQVVV